MKFRLPIIIALAVAAGWTAAKWPLSKAMDSSGRKIVCYQSPMHPWVKSDKPGQCTVCGMDLVPVYEGESGFDHAVNNVVMLPSGSPQVIGVQTSEVKKLPLLRTLRVAGMIGEDESRHGVISAPVEGRIDGLSMNHPGQQVVRRQPLATIFSKTLLAAAEDYKTALNQGEAAVQAAKRRLENHGLVWEQISAIPQRQPDDIYFGILAPLSGTVVKTYVSEGQYVKEGDRIFEIADYAKLWFMFPVYEKDLPLVQLGQVATLNLPSQPGVTLKARVAFINPILDEATRTASVRVVIENPERKIKVQTYAEGVLELDAPEVLAVPRTAVLWSSYQPRVYVEKAPGSYVPRLVKLGREGDASLETLEGLKEGDRVVTSANMLLDGQAQLDRQMQAP